MMRRRGEAHSGYPLGAAVTLGQLEHDPHPHLARLRAGEPVSWLPALDGWLVTRRDLALAVMRDAATFTVDDPRFSTAQVVGPSMLSLDGAEHARHRDPFARAFRLGETRARFTDFVERETQRLIDEIEPAGTAELRRTVAGPLAVAVVARALGLHDVQIATVLAWYEAIVGAVSDVTAGGTVGEAGRQAYDLLSANVGAALDLPPDSSLLAEVASDGGALSVPEVISNAAVIMFGGIETTEAMIANAALHLLESPEQLGLVRADPALVVRAVEESLRLEPAAAVVDRYATRAVDLGGASIAARDLVIVSLAGANRDPDVFTAPDRFDVRRDNARLQLAFAQGPHVCPGMHLARLEAQVAIGRLLERLSGLRLDPARANAARGLVFRKPPELHVVWDPQEGESPGSVRARTWDRTP